MAYLDSTRKTLVRKDWVVVCAVRCEPVSASNSLLAGKMQGILQIWTGLGQNGAVKLLILRGLFREFPMRSCRELNRRT